MAEQRCRQCDGEGGVMAWCDESGAYRWFPCWPCILRARYRRRPATCGPVNVDANGSPLPEENDSDQ